MPTIVIDLDGTLTIDDPVRSYIDALPNLPVIATLRNYKSRGFTIAIFTSRNMRSYEKSIGRINAHTIPIIVAWLTKHDVPYDEIHVGKPWPDKGGFYVDDRAIRPNEFLTLSHEEILRLTGGTAHDHIN